jgi:signal peptidase II
MIDKKNSYHTGWLNKTNITFFVMFVLLTFIDQISKYAASHFLADKDVSLIPGVLQLQYLENRGAAWGILQNKTWLLVSISIAVLILLIILYHKLSADRKFRLLQFCLVLLAAGALGNMIDRIVNRYVVDFIYISLIHFPVFNLADCFVCIASVLILYCVLFKYKDTDFKSLNEEK